MNCNQQEDHKTTLLPPFYNSITPLLSGVHGNLKLGERKNYSFAADATAILLTVEEFPAAERYYPIIFNNNRSAMPVALTGVPRGRNQFVMPDGRWRYGAYVPVYVRRYPFILAKARPSAKKLTLCFDSECSSIVESDYGNLFVGGQPSARTKAILQLCEWYEHAILKTKRFVEELEELGLLVDAAVDARLAAKESAVLRGYRVVQEENFKNLSDGQLRQLARSGALSLIHAHLFSLKNIERIFARHRNETRKAGIQPKERSAV